jgi:serine phosphatase RsbU (regulator of sigma subunit)
VTEVQPVEADELGSPTARPVTHALVVDDDADVNRLLQLRLRARGFDAVGVGDGRTALAHLGTRPVDLVFLDIALPDMNGLGVLERIRERSFDVAVILMTAFGSEEVVIAGLRGAADDYLAKPFRSEEFQAVLGRTVDRLTLARQNVALRTELEDKNRELEAELARAGRVQASLLPRRAPEMVGFELAGRCLPAHAVAGDFYDWQTPEPGVLSLSLCDVMGHGMPAALMMATVRAITRTVSRTLSPAEALAETARTLAPDFEHSNQYATAFIARLEVDTRTLRFADAGHGLALVRRADGTVDPPYERGLPLGLFTRTDYVDVVTHLDPGDLLVVYSDGLVENRTDWLRDRHAVARELEAVQSAADAADRLVEAAGPDLPPADDLTVTVLRCVPPTSVAASIRT